MEIGFLFRVSLTICWVYSALSCPNLCHCYFGEIDTEVICNNIPISDFPTNLPRNTTRLTIQFTNIARISGEDLGATPLLKELHLSNNKLTNLSTNMLSGLSYLHTIDLTGNQLKELPSQVFYHAQLDSLSLKNNLLSRVDADWFPANSNLTWIDLSGNHLRKVPEGLLQNLGHLVTLDLSENKLEALPAGVLDKQIHLERLSLQNNKLRYIDQLAFQNTAALSYLFLQHNHLDKLPPSLFLRVKELRYLDLSNNHLTNLVPGSLEPNVLFLDLSFNPWHCNRNIHYLWSWERKSVEWAKEDTKAVCSQPLTLKGRPVVSLSSDDFGM